MHNFRHILLQLTMLVLLIECNEGRASLIILSTPGTTYEADGYATFSTTSATMVGMQVTVNFNNNTSDTGIWTATGISQNGWSMTQGPGSTFTDPFTLTNNTRQKIRSFTMHGGGSTTLFDRGVLPSTAGTGAGSDLEEFTNLSQNQNVTVNYFDNVQTTGATPVGDIFAGMEVVFQKGIVRNGGQFVFRTDTDNSINLLEPLPVPETATAIRSSILFLGILLIRRRRNRGKRA